MTGSDMFDFSHHFDSYFKKSVTSNEKHKFKVTEYKYFIFDAKYRLNVKFSKDMNGSVLHEFPLLKPVVLHTQPIVLPSKALYPNRNAVKRANLEDVQSLFKYLKPETVEMLSKICTIDGADESGSESEG